MPTTRLIALVATLAALLLTAAAQAVTPTTGRMVSSSGQQLNGYQYSSDISRDGRWVTFSSDATNAGSPSGVRQIYLDDRVTGALTLISKAPADGSPGNGGSNQPSISADGRYVAFQTTSTNLGAPGTTNAEDDVFLYDRNDGSLRRLSTSLTGGDANDWARDAQLSADGSTVVFSSPASNLVPDDTAMIDVFAVSTNGGPIERVSARPDGKTANGASVNGDASDNGRFVTFDTDATDLGVTDANGQRDVVVLDRQTGRRELASVTSAGGQSNGYAYYTGISADGCWVVFNDTATNLVAGDDKTGAVKTYVHNRCTGSTEFASLRNDGTQDSVINLPPEISDDGCIVSMLSATLTPGAAAGVPVLRDRCQGATSRVDVSPAGELGNGGVIDWPRLSAGSGRFVSFDSISTNLATGDTNASPDVFVRDRGNAQPPVAVLDLRTDSGRVVADASRSSDPDGRIVSSKVTWGDGSPDDTGIQSTHAYTRSGTFTVTLIVTDSDGLLATTSAAITVGDAPGATTDATPSGPVDGPVITGSPSSRSSATKLALSHVVLSKRALTLNATTAAKLQLRFERLVPGHVAHAACSAGARHGKRCTARKAAGTLTVSLHAGANTIALPGRLGGHKLASGRYRVSLVARASDGRATSPLTRTLTIAKEHR
jgi:PKD domain/WD40-like Beta Propeller Repeat